jgi:hypothetical protein
LEDHTEISALSFVIHNGMLGLADCRCSRVRVAAHCCSSTRPRRDE